jgi:hypothetical protein
MILTPGKIIHVFCVFAKPPKHKYAVCVCPRARFFFLINSKPRNTLPDAQVLISSSDFTFLTEDSYINTGTICVISEDEINHGKEIDFLTESLKSKIIKVTENCKYHSPANKDLIARSLSERD